MELDIYKSLYIEALDSVTSKSNLYFYRKICRWFSETLSTPIREVEQMPWDYVITHYYEAHLEKLDNNQLIDIIINSIPELKDTKDKEAQEFMDFIIKKDQEKKNKSNKKQSLDIGNHPKEINTTFDLIEDI